MYRLITGRPARMWDLLVPRVNTARLGQDSPSAFKLLTRLKVHPAPRPTNQISELQPIPSTLVPTVLPWIKSKMPFRRSTIPLGSWRS